MDNSKEQQESGNTQTQEPEAQSATQVKAGSPLIPEIKDLGEIKTNPYEVREATPLGPVYITRIRSTGAKTGHTFELQLLQSFSNPLVGQAAALNIMMEGHSAFNSERKRVAWQGVSAKVLEAIGFSSEAVLKLGTVEFKPEELPELKVPNPVDRTKVLKCVIVEVDTFVPRRWYNSTAQLMEQAPKKAGAEGDLLICTVNGIDLPIYSNRFLSFEGTQYKGGVDPYKIPYPGREWNQDLIIPHTNQVTGSNQRKMQTNAIANAGAAAIMETENR